MPMYHWKGMTADGNEQRGSLDARSEQDLQQKLFEQNIALLDCKQKRSWAFSFNYVSFFHNYDDERIAFFEHLALLLDSGVSLSQALSLYVKQAKHRSFKRAIVSILQKINSGETLASSMQQFSLLFPLFITQLTQAAEKTGTLAHVFSSISKHLKAHSELKKSIRQAALLPIITLLFAGVIIAGIFGFIIPQFSSFFSMMGKPIPPLTQKIIAMSNFMRQPYGIMLLAFLLLLPLVIKFLLRIKPVKHFKDHLVVMLSSHFLLSDLVYFLEGLHLFLQAGVPVKQALMESSCMINNGVLREKVLLACESINQGKSLAVSLTQAGTGIFPQKLIALIALGEESGTLDRMVSKTIVIFKCDLKAVLTTVTTVLQPILLLLIGLIIAFLMVAVYLPIFNLATIIT